MALAQVRYAAAIAAAAASAPLNLVTELHSVWQLPPAQRLPALRRPLVTGLRRAPVLHLLAAAVASLCLQCGVKSPRDRVCVSHPFPLSLGARSRFIKPKSGSTAKAQYKKGEKV